MKKSGNSIGNTRCMDLETQLNAGMGILESMTVRLLRWYVGVVAR